MKKLLIKLTNPLRAHCLEPLLAYLSRRRERRVRGARAVQNARLFHVGGTIRRG